MALRIDLSGYTANGIGKVGQIFRRLSNSALDGEWIDLPNLDGDIVYPGDNGSLRAADEADVGRLAVEHGNLRVGTRVSQDTPDVTLRDFQASDYQLERAWRGVVSLPADILNPSNGDLIFSETYRAWYEYDGTDWAQADAPNGWRGVSLNKAASDHRVTAVGQVVWWPNAPAVQVVTAVAHDTDDVAYEWRPEEERQELLRREISAALQGNQSAYSFRSKLDVAPAAIAAAQAVPTTGDGYRFEIVPDTVVQGKVEPDNDFVTEWEGTLFYTPSTSGVLEIHLITRHTIGQVSFDISRIVSQSRITGGAEELFRLSNLNTRSQVSLGDYVNNGNTLTFTEAELQGPTTIAYFLEFVIRATRGAARKAGNISGLSVVGGEVYSYQLRQAVVTEVDTGGGGTGEDNVQADWVEADDTSDAFIRNKPGNATNTEAQAPSGINPLLWSVSLLRSLVNATLPTISSEDALAGTSTARRIWTAARLRAVLNAFVPAWARVGDATLIPVAKLANVSTMGVAITSITDLRDFPNTIARGGRPRGNAAGTAIEFADITADEVESAAGWQNLGAAYTADAARDVTDSSFRIPIRAADHTTLRTALAADTYKELRLVARKAGVATAAEMVGTNQATRGNWKTAGVLSVQEGNDIGLWNVELRSTAASTSLYVNGLFVVVPAPTSTEYTFQLQYREAL